MEHNAEHNVAVFEDFVVLCTTGPPIVSKYF